MIMTAKEYCNSCQNKGSHKCQSCCGKYRDGVLQGKPTEYRKKQQTNADRIRAMSDEELAELVAKYFYCGLCPVRHKCITDEFQPCNKVVMYWLKQPAEGE
jgi:hypothetical protein